MAEETQAGVGAAAGWGGVTAPTSALFRDATVLSMSPWHRKAAGGGQSDATAGAAGGAPQQAGSCPEARPFSLGGCVQAEPP